jgi:hypothetical protein
MYTYWGPAVQLAALAFHKAAGNCPDSCNLLMSKLLLLSIRFAQLLGMDPLNALPLMLKRSKSEVLFPQGSGRVPESLLELRSNENTLPGANAASRLGGRVPVIHGSQARAVSNVQSATRRGEASSQ